MRTQNPAGELLVVKEANRDYWDLPGGGMDHGETLQQAIAREPHEEVNLQGAFTYRVLHVEEPSFLDNHNFWQMRIIFAVVPDSFEFSPGVDSDEVMFLPPTVLGNSGHSAERAAYRYSLLA